MTYIEKLWEKYQIPNNSSVRIFDKEALRLAIQEAMQAQRRASAIAVMTEIDRGIIALTANNLKDIILNAEVIDETTS